MQTVSAISRFCFRSRLSSAEEEATLVPARNQTKLNGRLPQRTKTVVRLRQVQILWEIASQPKPKSDFGPGVPANSSLRFCGGRHKTIPKTRSENAIQRLEQNWN